MVFDLGRLARDTKLDSTVKTAVYYKTRTCYKVLKSGKFYEVYISQIPFKTGQTTPETYKNREKIPQESREDEYQGRSRIRAKNKIKRLIQSNFTYQSKFITLTFRNTDNFDVTDMDACHKRFKYFMGKMYSMYGEFKYIAVPEYQEKNKRHAVHYHLVANLPYISTELLSRIWIYGYVYINMCSRPKKVGVYLTKYLTKESFNSTNKGRRRYLRSKKLNEPILYYGLVGDRIAKLLLSRYRTCIIYQSEYMSKINGIIRYYELFINGG
jgi:hypothetical protein